MAGRRRLDRLATGNSLFNSQGRSRLARLAGNPALFVGHFSGLVSCQPFTRCEVHAGTCGLVGVD